MRATLTFKDGTVFEGNSFGYESGAAGEVAFSTSMTGYPESLTDPSYRGQILTLSYPLIGNYGVPPKKYWESDAIQVSGLVVSRYSDSPPVHAQSIMSLSDWLKEYKIPALEISDTRAIVKKIRDGGAALVTIEFEKKISFSDPNARNLVAEVSTRGVAKLGTGKKKIVLIDCGVKENIIRELLKRDTTVIRVPWDYDIVGNNLNCDGVLVSNGPGDPKMADVTIRNVKKILSKKIPVFGICLGNQILALAAGGDTFKLPFGHRGQNQPCAEVGTNKCYITTQNHGFAIGKIPEGFKEWFVNSNDKTNEGIIHKKLPFMSVQFHPEAAPGPMDTTWLFDFFISKI